MIPLSMRSIEMKSTNLFCCIICFSIFLHCCAQEIIEKPLKVIFTAALIENQWEMRKQEYIYSLNSLLGYGLSPYIVEACKTSSFLDEYKLPIFYPNVNDTSLRNKGVNEARLLLEALNHFEFDDDDLILKFTGRYFFTSFEFPQFLLDNSDADFVVRMCGHNNQGCLTACFAAKYKYFKKFLEQLDLKKMEREMINFEDELANFLNRNPEIKTIRVDTLNLTANCFGTGQTQLLYY